MNTHRSHHAASGLRRRADDLHHLVGLVFVHGEPLLEQTHGLRQHIQLADDVRARRQRLGRRRVGRRRRRRLRARGAARGMGGAEGTRAPSPAAPGTRVRGARRPPAARVPSAAPPRAARAAARAARGGRLRRTRLLGGTVLRRACFAFAFAAGPGLYPSPSALSKLVFQTMTLASAPPVAK